MSAQALFDSAWPMAAMAVLGLGFGLAYFAALRRSVAQLAGAGSWLLPAALGAGRLGAAVLLFVLVARHGAAALLATLAGFLIARSIAVGRARSLR